MLWLGFDVETTGLNEKEDAITEIGAVLWDTELSQPVMIQSDLVKIGTAVPEMITKLTGITDGMLNTYGIDPELVAQKLSNNIHRADYVVAHNAPFDKKFYEAFCNQYGIEIVERPWIDTHKHLPNEAYEKGKSNSLPYLAADHGFLNPFAHRAVTDVLTMLRVASMYDADEIVANSLVVRKWFRAKVTFDQKDWAKERNYRWNGDKKWWLKEMSEAEFNREIEEVGDRFPVVGVQL